MKAGTEGRPLPASVPTTRWSPPLWFPAATLRSARYSPGCRWCHREWSPLTEWRPAAGRSPHAADLYAGVAHAPAYRSW